MKSFLSSVLIFASVQVSAQPAINGDGVTTRSSCVHDTASMHVKTKKILRTHEESLQTSADWTVNGKIYSMVYIFQSEKGNNPLPTFIQMVRTQKNQAGGIVASSTSQALMLTPSTGKVENFSFTKDNFAEVDANGQQMMYEWANEQKGALITMATQVTQADGTIRTDSTDVNPAIHNGWTTAPEGSRQACTITGLSREAWLVVATDPKLTADITNLDSLAFAAKEAEASYKTCTQATCPQLYADLAAKEQAFAKTFNGLFDKRKTELNKQYKAVRAKIEARRRAAAAARRSYDRGSAYNSNNSGVAAALAAIEAAKEQSYRNSVVRELEEIRRALERQRRF